MNNPPRHAKAAVLPAPWGAAAMQEGVRALWRLGPLELWVRRRRHEWRVAARWDPSASSERVTRQVPAEEEPQKGMQVLRFGQSETTNSLRVLPVLASLPVVCRPEGPFVVHAGQSVVAYVGTPLWARLVTAEADPLHEVDIHRPSRSWFGPNTVEGELAYASRTSLHLDWKDMGPQPTRALTRIEISNDGTRPLTVSEINVPMPHLELGLGGTCSMWTESLTLTSADDGLVNVEIGGFPDGVTPLDLPLPRVPRAERRFTAGLTQFFR